MTTAQIVIEQLTAAITAFPHVNRVILYGSRARGDYTTFSDIDIAVSGDLPPTEWQNIRRLAHVEDNTIRTLHKIDIVHLDTASQPLQESIHREGKILYARN